MKFFKKILILSAIVAALFFVTNGKQDLAASIAVEKSESSYNDEGLHALAFIQPQADHHVVSENKSGNAFFAKTIHNPFVLATGFVVSKPLQKLLFQDSNRCESVSLLIFPFHLFW